MCKIALLAALAPLAWSGAAVAQDKPPASERRLSPAQVEAILDEAAARREAAARPSLDEPVEDDAPAAQPQVHGEVGFGIGTGGYREIYGTALYPLGNDGFAAISLDFVDLGPNRFRH